MSWIKQPSLTSIFWLYSFPATQPHAANLTVFHTRTQNMWLLNKKTARPIVTFAADCQGNIRTVLYIDHNRAQPILLDSTSNGFYLNFLNGEHSLTAHSRRTLVLFTKQTKETRI